MHCTTDQTFVTKSMEHTHVHRFWISYNRHDLKARTRSHFTGSAYLRLYQSPQLTPSLFDLLSSISKSEARAVMRAPVTFVLIKYLYLPLGSSTCRRGTMQHLAPGSTSKILFGGKSRCEKAVTLENCSRRYSSFMGATYSYSLPTDGSVWW
jgi:hypothetical protein